MKKKILYVKKENFCDWYFDEETNQAVVEELIEKGKVTLQDCLSKLCYIPLSLVTNKKRIDKNDTDDGEIKMPAEKYELRFAEGMKKVGYYITIQQVNLQGTLPKKLAEDELSYWAQDEEKILPTEYYIKWDDRFEESIAIMARAGVCGEVVIMGEEGEYTKYVLKNNRVEIYYGVVIFPDKPNNIIIP